MRILLPLLFATSFLLGDPHLQIRTSTDRHEVTVGETLEFTITVVFDPRLQVKKPGPGAGLGDFEIRNYEFKTPQMRADGLVEDVSVYRLAAWETGQFQLPSLAAEGAWGGRKITARSEPLAVEVKSVARERGTNEAPAEASGPYEIGGVWPLRTWIALLAALFLASGAILAIRSFRLRPEDAETEAEKTLAELDRQGFLADGLTVDHYYAFSMIVRRWGERTQGRPWTAWSTREILASLEGTAGEESDFLREFLPRADEVKYGGVCPEAGETESFRRRFAAILANARRRKSQP